jgi:hypothetical protein
MVTRPVRTNREIAADAGRSPSDYVVPVVHVHLPEPVVKAGFYGGLATAAVVGALDWPLARNHRKTSGDRLSGTEPAQMSRSCRRGV